MVKFISYDGAFPNLCGGELVLEIDGVRRNDFELCSGGRVWFGDNWEDHVESGPWTVCVPKDLEGLKEEITRVVNENIPWGCCGGCV